MKRYLHIIYILGLLLLAGGIVNGVWAAKVTYHILTLPIPNPATPGNYNYHMKSDVIGHRLEAFKIVVDNQTIVELPAHYKSPLATGFTYYEPKDITGHGGSAVSLYDDIASRKGILYDVVASPTPVAERTEITTSTAEYYVVYTYNESNTIAKLDGSVNYNIGVKGKGFLSLNRGRNNRPAVIPTAKVDPEMLASPDFSYVESPGNGISTYWSDGNNKNTRDSTESKFFFIFKFEGKDPYHIVVKTSYARNYTYIEQNDDKKGEFVYKWYKESTLFAKTTGNAYLASDDHIRYKTAYNSAIPNPTDPAYDDKTGFFHGNDSYWSNVALLNNTAGDGYVFMGSRTVDGNGNVPGPKDNTKYYYLTFNGYNNLNFNQISAADATKSHTVDGIYPIKKVTFKVATPFYATDPTTAHIVSVPDWVSQYTVENDPIETKYLPTSLRRKYCQYTGKFYSDAACTEEITYFSQATDDPTEGYQVYIGYNLTSDIPFKGITPAATYNAETWANATWYELTDEASTQADGLKLKYDGTNFKNNGADNVYDKTTEFAFIGDPYELQVVYRDATSGATPYYVGAAGTPPTTGTALTASTTASEGFLWELPNDATVGSFLLKKYQDEGNWYWDAGHPNPVSIAYDTKANTYNVSTANAQVVTFNVSNLGYTEGDYILVTAGGTNSDQVTVTGEKIYVQDGGTASFTAAIKGRGDDDKQFTLSIQKYNSSDVAQGTASVVTVNQNNDAITANTVEYSTASSTRIKVMTLPTRDFTYNIVDISGNIAIKAKVKQTIFSPISGYASIPEVIRSPFLADETITFYDDNYVDGSGRGTLTHVVSEVSNADDDIFVTYTTANLSKKSIKLDDSQQFKVKLNEEHIYYDTSTSTILSTPAADTDNKYSWGLEGQDPYAMKIRNVGNSNKYVKVHNGSWGDDTALDFVEGIENGSRFIAMMSAYLGVYEVLAASGTTDYYHIARPSTTGAETKIYSVNTAGYAHGADPLRFELAGVDAITYHLIDKANTELLSVSSFNPRLVLPAEYQSPLVKEYYYYPTRAKATSNLAEDRITEIKDDTKEDNTTPGDNDIYVTYEANDVVKFNSGQYMLKFLDPAIPTYHLEDGNDKLTTTTIKPIYPYCNGDGNLNIYGDDMQKEQFNGGASTRPRWVWYFTSGKSDPYHVSIRSRSTINYNGIGNQTYLTTYAVHFNQDTGENANKKRVVTGGTLPGIESVDPTEYMVLGTIGNYKLMTTYPVAADLNGDGDTDDTVDGVSENARRNVTSLEQYWKTYNMVKLDVLGISNTTDAYSDDESTWVVPKTNDPETDGVDESTYRTTLAAKDWHSYDAYANATRWNGYNDKRDGHEKKVVEKLEHWFQTFDMGTGTFDIESADIPPVLVLLDRHGWEIMRRPLPSATTYPEGDVELAGLRVYDSPLVDKYYFYSNATKASGCHKYTLRLNDKNEERDQIKVNGVHYSSSSLGDLPPMTATGVVSSGAIQDFYVTFTVKDEYENNYDYNLDYDEIKDGDKVTGYTFKSETGTSQPYLVLQNGRFYKAKNDLSNNTSDSYISKPISEHTDPEGGNVYDLIVSPHNHGGTNNNIIYASGENIGKFIGNNFWYVKPNLNIDEEMGIVWGTAISGAEPLSKIATQVTYKDKSGFDPYNIQLQLKSNNDGTTSGKYLTTHMTSARLDDGILVGNYEGGSMKITLETACTTPVSSEGYDHTNMQITNQTFMAVSDANGNMQLMPRFDHTQRVDLEGVSPWESKLKDPVDHAKASADDNSSMGPQTTFFVRPQRFHYHIIDNNGREALRYKRGADFYPAITDHFKSPLAKDFTYYKNLTLTDGIYTEIRDKEDISGKQITGSFAAAELDGVDCDVYVRYNYDEDADQDADKILQGPWLTVKLAEKDLQANGTVVTTVGNTQGTGVALYKGETSRSLTATDDADVVVQAQKLTSIGDFYFKQKDADNYWLVKVSTAYNGETNAVYTKTSGSYATEWSNSKPLVIDADDGKWQWKFLQAPTDPSSAYYVEPDPYAVQIFNRQANYTDNPSVQPSPMAVGIKVPNANDGADRFVLLSHPNGGYALVVAKEYDNNYNYLFLNGASMTTSVAATTATEANFNYKTGTLTTGAQVLVDDDVTHNYTYNVITNEKINENVNVGNKLAITVNQDNVEAASHSYAPYLPESAQTPLLNMEDYLYYGFAREVSSTYSVIEQTKLHTLYGLYDDMVYVRYNAYDMDKTSFKVPNKKTTDGGHVARESTSVDASLNIEDGLPYNIIWYNDNIMQSTDDAAVSDGGSHDLSGDRGFVWYFTGGDPYALKIKHKGGKYLDGTATMVEEASAPTFMLLRKNDYDYGILQLTGTTGDNAGKKLTGFGGALTADANTDPTEFIIFGLSVHDLIYHLIIAKTCELSKKSTATSDQYVDITYSDKNDPIDLDYNSATGKLRVYGSSQRDLTSIADEDDPHKLPGDKYQLGETLSWNNPAEYHTYCYDAGAVSLGDDLTVPNVFNRPNCTFEFYIEGIYQNYADPSNPNQGKPYTDLNSLYQGLKLKKLMSDDNLIDQTVVVNIVYSFDKNVATNTGLDFVRSTDDKCWYTYETQGVGTPYLAHYTNAWGLQTMEGRETRYSNDYLWTPVGDVYGFQLYNRYMIKNSDGSDKVMTFDGTVSEGKNLAVAKPGSTVEAKEYTSGNEIFELLPGDNPNSGYFRVHPVVNTKEQTQYYVKRDASDNNYAKLSTTPSDWTFGLDMSLMEPYYERAGYVGGLTPEGKTAYETAVSSGTIMDIQHVVFDDENIINFTSGYYRLHNQPGVSGIAPVRYASGYLHNLELDWDGTSSDDNSDGDNSYDPIPMHFYSKEGVLTSFAGEGGLGSGFTDTNATRGEIPIAPTERDPSTIFYIHGSVTGNPTISTATMSTQGLNVLGNNMTEGDGTRFTLIDIGGATFLIADKLDPATRQYFSFDQTSNIYDLNFAHEVPTDDAKWCLQPVQKTATVGDGEMPLQITTNQGGDGHYYATFYAPFDVLLPADGGGHTYYAYYCKTWDNTCLHPTAVPAATVNAVAYGEGKFVPAGTPVIIRTTDESNIVTLTLPSSSPTASSITTDLMGSYLERMLPLDTSHDVYTFGLPFTSGGISIDRSTGIVTAPLVESATTGVGFYINATPNKEHNALQSMWQRNNRYVLHNKIYYREGGPSYAPGRGKVSSRVEYVPVIFDFDEEEQQEEDAMATAESQYDGNVYDMLGRRVATAQQVRDGSWRRYVAPGIYIVQGRRVAVK